MISHGHTSLMSPKSMEAFVRSAWQICVTHVVPHFGYVTTKTSVGRGLNERPTFTLSGECIRLFRADISCSARRFFRSNSSVS